MSIMPDNYVEKVYAGWLGKLIGIRHGAPIEMWTDETIKKVYGEIDGYLVDYKDFAADDDSNGPAFFVRALEDYAQVGELRHEHMGLTWLNYIPSERSFLWWGGYGVSTEHTAYLNLRAGIMPPQSGSIEQNGAVVAEQIGGQIFIDSFGLVAPNNPQLAVHYAGMSASVSHDGDGRFGGMFIAACISAAFGRSNLDEIIQAGLSVIPSNATYALAVREVQGFYDRHPKDWQACLAFIKQNFWDDKFGGNCHIIPNAAIIVLSLLYGQGDFSQTINICNMCGFDTDCNVANVGTIMGVFCGLEGIDYDKWRAPINDFFACSSVIGSLNIQDAASFSLYLARLGYRIAGQQPPARWADALAGETCYGFELPGATHGVRVCSSVPHIEARLRQTTEQANSGCGCLKLVAKPLDCGDEVRAFIKTYYRPTDFHNNRYDPNFSPILYPGQTLSVSVRGHASSVNAFACLYVKDGNSGIEIESEKIALTADAWQRISLPIPPKTGWCIEQAGVRFICAEKGINHLVAFIDDVAFSGTPDYALDFAKERMEVWTRLRAVPSQFTMLKGLWTLEDGSLLGSCADFGEAYTGAINMTDYEASATLVPQVGECAGLIFRVQGGVRSYAACLVPGKLALLKNNNGYTTLAEAPLAWKHGDRIEIHATVAGNQICVSAGAASIAYQDCDRPYLTGQIGAMVRNGSRCQFQHLSVAPCNHVRK